MVFAVHGKLLNQEVNDNTYKKQIETIAKKQPEEHFWSQQETESSLAGHLGSCLAQHEWERESEMERGKLPLRRSFTAAAAIIYLKIIATSITGQRHTESESQSETQRSLKRTPVPEHFIIIGQQQIVADRRFAALVFFCAFDGTETVSEAGWSQRPDMLHTHKLKCTTFIYGSACRSLAGSLGSVEPTEHRKRNEINCNLWVWWIDLRLRRYW